MNSTVSCNNRLLKAKIMSFLEGQEFTIIDQVLSNAATVRLAEQLAELPELQSLTMENNRITDEQAVCALLQNLKNFDKIEKQHRKAGKNMVKSGRAGGRSKKVVSRGQIFKFYLIIFQGG